jgi:hypothetical protein
VSVRLGVFLAVAFFVVLIGGAVALFASMARQIAREPRWRDLYRLRDPLPPGMAQDARAAARNRGFENAFTVAKDKVLSYVFGSSTVAHLGPGSAGDMDNDPFTDHGVEISLDRGSAYLQRGDLAVKVTMRGLTIAPDAGSRLLAELDGKDVVVHCFRGVSVVGPGTWSFEVREGTGRRFLATGGAPLELDTPAEARALDAALALSLTPESPQRGGE